MSAVFIFSALLGHHLCIGIERHIFLYHAHKHEIRIQPVTKEELEAANGVADQYALDGIDYSQASDSTENYVHDDVENISKITFSHAESPVWDPEARTLYWVDVLKQEVHALNYVTLKHKVRHINYGEVNVVIPVANSRSLLVGCRSKVFLMEWHKPKLQLIAQLQPKKRHNIFNEGKCDAFGRLWAGTKGPQIGDSVQPGYAGLYKLQPPCYKPSAQLRNITISNGLVWSLNNTLLYYIDSATNKIEAFDFDLQKGKLGNRRTILDTTGWGFREPIPDGMTIDRDGYLWVALFLYGSIIRINPDEGRIVSQYELPVSRVTSLAWAGEELEDLVVTTSRRNVQNSLVAAHPLSGTIFLFRNLGTGGVPDHKFQYERFECDNKSFLR